MVESVIPVPAPGTAGPVIVLRNTGGQTANLTNYRLVASGAGGGNASADAKDALVIGKDRACRDNTTLDAGEPLVWRPRGDGNICGYTFGLNTR